MRQTGRRTVREYVRRTVREYVRQTGREYVRQTVRECVRQTVREYGRDYPPYGPLGRGSGPGGRSFCGHRWGQRSALSSPNAGRREGAVPPGE
jgi:hypothetical protein